MVKQNRWLCLFLTLVLFFSLMPPAQASARSAEPFAAFLIDAEDTDSPAVDLHVQLYRRGASSFQAGAALRYTCQINRAAGSTSFHIQPRRDGVWATVDYLTDLNQDGIYEMLDGQDAPVSDSVDSMGNLLPWSQSGQQILAAGQTYTFSAQTLSARGQAAVKARSTPGGGQLLDAAGPTLPDPDTLLYLVTLHCMADGQEQQVCYYVRLYDSVIVPSDVPAGSWYYDAVEYVLTQGLLSGTGSDRFSPVGTVTRAQLAQILWRLGGSPRAESSAFSDVSPSDWFQTAVAWCSQEGLMSGLTDGRFSPNTALSREQLALVLRQYAKRAGRNVDVGKGLSGFRDGPAVSLWARASMEWAVEIGLLSGDQSGSLHPVSGVTRAELAVVLRNYCHYLGL